jgi:hypothetical protein
MVDPMTVNYNLTKMASSTHLVDFISTVNQYSEGILFGILIIGIFLIITLALSRFGFDYAFITAGFICFILSGFLALAKLLTFIYPITFLVITMLVAFYLFATKS